MMRTTMISRVQQSVAVVLASTIKRRSALKAKEQETHSEHPVWVEVSMPALLSILVL